jgi:hypothetical protein
VGRNLQDHLVTQVSVSLTAADSAALNFWDIVSPLSLYDLGNECLFHLQKIILASVADSDAGSGAFLLPRSAILFLNSLMRIWDGKIRIRDKLCNTDSNNF